ncbi:MAG: TOBE domain-containing protein, partial [Burkholderiaceae bacterium]
CGLRPEHIIEQRPQLEPRQHPFEVTVEVVEPMGMETLIYFPVNGVLVCARIDPDAAAGPGERIKLAVDMGKMHLIDDESGAVL